MKELKGLKVDELLAKLKANGEAITAFEAAKLTDSPYYKSAVEEKAAIEEELSSRKGEMLASAVSDAVSATISKELKGKEADIEKDVTLTVTISKNAETGEITVKTTSGKPRKVSEGGVTSSGGARGERKGAKVTLLDGTVFEKPSAAEALQHLKDTKVIDHKIGEGDSAVRVLDSLVVKKQIAAFERTELQKAEKTEKEPATESENKTEVEPGDIQEAKTDQKGGMKAKAETAK